MDRRRLATFLAINAALSVAVTLIVLSVWESSRTSLALPAVAPTAPALSSPSPPPSTQSSAATAEATSAPTSAPAPSATPAGPTVYTVQAGDTLGDLAVRFDVSIEDILAANEGLTEDALLSIGQEIIIPRGEPTAAEPVEPGTTPTTRPTEQAASPAAVVIREVQSPGVLGAETVILTNLGGVVKLAGWSLSDGGENRYVFPDVTLFAGAELSLHSGSGPTSPSNLYWGREAAVWTSGVKAYLRDAAGLLVAEYRVP